MQLRFTRGAYSQLHEIFSYIAQDSAAAATRVRARIEYVAGLLAENPRLGRKVSRSGVRMMPVPGLPYLIFYEIAEDEVVITRVRHAARRRPAFHESEGEFRV